MARSGKHTSTSAFALSVPEAYNQLSFETNPTLQFERELVTAAGQAMRYNLQKNALRCYKNGGVSTCGEFIRERYAPSQGGKPLLGPHENMGRLVSRPKPLKLSPRQFSLKVHTLRRRVLTIRSAILENQKNIMIGMLDRGEVGVIRTRAVVY